jgi:hypothetical protein
MYTLTSKLKQHEAARLYVFDRKDFPEEVVPAETDAVVAELVAELAADPAVRLPAIADEAGLYGWPADGIRKKIGEAGGSIRFGWRLRQWPDVLLTAEFHAVWVDPDGTMRDITPAITVGDTSLFVPDASYAEDFDWDLRPISRYRVLYAEPDRSPEVAARIAQLKRGQRAYEARRAQKAGLTLEAWIRGKLADDPMVIAIDAFIAACMAFDEGVAELPDMMISDPYPEDTALPGQDSEDADDDDDDNDNDDEDDAESEIDDSNWDESLLEGDDDDEDDSEDQDNANEEWTIEDEAFEADERLRELSDLRSDCRKIVEALLQRV